MLPKDAPEQPHTLASPPRSSTAAAVAAFALPRHLAAVRAWLQSARQTASLGTSLWRSRVLRRAMRLRFDRQLEISSLVTKSLWSQYFWSQRSWLQHPYSITVKLSKLRSGCQISCDVGLDQYLAEADKAGAEQYPAEYSVKAAAVALQ